MLIQNLLMVKPNLRKIDNLIYENPIWLPVGTIQIIYLIPTVCLILPYINHFNIYSRCKLSDEFKFVVVQAPSCSEKS